MFSEEAQQSLKEYVERPLKYFASEIYLEANLQKLYNAVGILPHLLSADLYNKKKRLLDFQAQLAGQEASN
ncbi:MAG: hypothetical protein WBB45_00005 [Cyclobacteriaceae bacterium]